MSPKPGPTGNMGTMTERFSNNESDNFSLLRLLHLASPSLPTGSFAYSQGLEWAVETGWITDGAGFSAWLSDLLEQAITYIDIPILVRMHDACLSGSERRMAHWCSILLACRETSELREEERTRGRALVALLKGIDSADIERWHDTISSCHLGGFALTAVSWRISIREAALGYVWSWLENQVLAGVKIIPLGQTEGQRILHRLNRRISLAVNKGMKLPDQEIGASVPALAIGSSCHETQYTRLFRS